MPANSEELSPVRAIRVPDELWVRVKAKADHNGDSVSHVIRRALFAYVRD